MKKNIAKILGVILIILGILLFFNKVFLNKSIENNVKNSTEVFQSLDSEELSENLENETEYNYDEVDYISPSKTFLKLNENDKKNIIGQLTIPNIDVNVVIFNGVSEEKLLKGVSTMKPGQEMGKGNFALAGHYGIKNQLFANIDKMQNGDIIKLTDKKNIYIYEMFDREIVPPTEISMIDDSKSEEVGKPIISLMSCYYVNGKNTGDRIFVKGVLKDIIPYTEKDMINK